MLAERNPSTDPMNAHAAHAAKAAIAAGSEMMACAHAVSPAASVANPVFPAQSEADAIEAALAWHGGDPRATIETLLADCGHLRVQLAAARNCISRGLTRGWLPEPDRPVAEV